MPSGKTRTEGLRKLLEDRVAGIYYAEKRLLVATKKMAKEAVNEELQQAFMDHHAETQGHVERLEKVFALLDKPAKGKKCDAIDGLIDETNGIIDEFKDDVALDAALVAFAEQPGLKKVAEHLNANLEEEKAADETLSALAEAVLNATAEV